MGTSGGLGMSRERSTSDQPGAGGEGRSRSPLADADRALGWYGGGTAAGRPSDPRAVRGDRCLEQRTPNPKARQLPVEGEVAHVGRAARGGAEEEQGGGGPAS